MFKIDESYTCAGRLRRAWGVKGQVTVDWNNDSCPVDVGSGNIYLYRDDGGEVEKFTVLADKRHGNCNIVTLKEFVSRTESERYAGAEIWVKKDDLQSLEEGEYYCYQLIGKKIVTLEGEHLGIVVDVISTGSNDVYVVKDGEDEILIPAIDDVVKEIDLEKGIIKIVLLEGLK